MSEPTRIAHIRDNVVEQVSLRGANWQVKGDVEYWVPPEGVLIVPSDVAGIGWGWDGSAFVPPPAPPEPAPLPKDELLRRVMSDSEVKVSLVHENRVRKLEGKPELRPAQWRLELIQLLGL